MTIKLQPQNQTDRGAVVRAKEILSAHGWSTLLLHYEDGSMLMSDDRYDGLEQALRDEVAMLRSANRELVRQRDVDLMEIARLREALRHYQNHPPPHPPVAPMTGTEYDGDGL